MTNTDSMKIDGIFDAIDRCEETDSEVWRQMQEHIEYKKRRLDNLKNKDIDNSIKNKKLKEELELEERFLIALMAFILLFGAGFSALFIFYYQVN